MKQIKTVTAPYERAEWFDNSINELTAKGWTLTKRDFKTVPGVLSEAFNAPMVQILYAELERHIPPFPEEITN